LLVCGVDIAGRGLPAALAANDEQARRLRAPYLQPETIRRSFQTFIDVFPADAHRRASGRLFIAVTEVPRFRRRLVSEFGSRQDLIDAMMASMALPGHGVWVAFRTRRHGWCLDGALWPQAEDERSGWHTHRIAVSRRRFGLPPG